MLAKKWEATPDPIMTSIRSGSILLFQSKLSNCPVGVCRLVSV